LFILFMFPIPFMMALLIYIHVEIITFDQWFICTLIVSSYPNVIVTISFFIFHHIYSVCYNLFQLNHIIINLLAKLVDFPNDSSDLFVVLHTFLLS
jgi:hypothetical protein